MRAPVLSASAVIIMLSACGGGGPAELGYGVPATSQVDYSYGDTTVVSVSMMGQSMEIAMRGEATYAVGFARAGSGVGVTLLVESLSGSVSMPMAAPQTLSESDVEGELAFTLDRYGNATVTSTPEVSTEASRMISSLATAHTFFPGLPGRAVSPGDEWVDTVSYEGDAELGATTEKSVLRYTVAGDTVVAGRTLLKIALAGTSELSNEMDMGGMMVAQSSNVDVTGHVLWDASAGLMYEVVRASTGRGSVSVPIAPQALPIEVRSVQRARLRGM